MTLVKYPRLTSDEKIELSELTTQNWKTFTQQKSQQKDIRYLFLEEKFWGELVEISFGYAEWEENPFNYDNPKFFLTLMDKKFNGFYLTGYARDIFELDSASSSFILTAEETLVFQEIFEEFDGYEYIMKMDAFNYIDSY